MRNLAMTLAAVACFGLAAPTFASERVAGQTAPQIANQTTTDLSAAGKKKPKVKKTTKRKSWGG